MKNTRNLFKVGQDIIDIQSGRILSIAEKLRVRLGKEKDKGKDMEKGEANEAIAPKEPKDPTTTEEKVEEDAAENATVGKRLLPPGAKSLRIWNKVGALPSEAIYLVTEYNRINEAADPFCWFMVLVELIMFYVYPLITLFMINWNLAVLFFICATTSGLRHYINAAVVIEEFGNMDLAGGETDEEKWENKSRLSTIVNDVTKGKSRNIWTMVLGAAGFGFLAIFLSAVGTSTENTDDGTFTYLPNFSYPGLSDDMRYPTCTLSNIDGGFGKESTLIDYAFMASIAYRLEENTQPALDGWFGPSGTNATYEKEYVDEFRAKYDQDNLPVFFKMFSFPEQGLGMIVIRGTSNNWDMVCFVGD